MIRKIIIGGWVLGVVMCLLIAVVALMNRPVSQFRSYDTLVSADAAVLRELSSPRWQKRVGDAYGRGVRDALDAFVLLNLEQQLQGTNRTFGAMRGIVLERLGVESSKH